MNVNDEIPTTMSIILNIGDKLSVIFSKKNRKLDIRYVYFLKKKTEFIGRKFYIIDMSELMTDTTHRDKHSIPETYHIKGA